MNEPWVTSIHVGTIAPLGPDGVPSGFVKHRVSNAVTVTPFGIVGDEQADLRVHGGPDKADYGYASAHYAAWRREYPKHTDLLVAGALGENLSIDGMTEAELCVHATGGIDHAPQRNYCRMATVEGHGRIGTRLAAARRRNPQPAP